MRERRKNLRETFGFPEDWKCWFKGDHWRICAVIRDGETITIPECLGEVHGHELKKRSQGGSITDMANVVLLCDFHNEWVEREPHAAQSLGLVRHSWE